MGCDSLSYDNRETCTLIVPSGCVPYTGEIQAIIEDVITVECKPNINDIFKALQTVLSTIKAKLGNYDAIDADCLDINPSTATQAEINGEIFAQICEIKTLLATLGGPIDPSTIMLAVNLLCLLDPSCDPATEYSLEEIIIKLIAAICNLITRVTNIETILNL